MLEAERGRTWYIDTQRNLVVTWRLGFDVGKR